MFHRAWIAIGPRWQDPAQRQAIAREFLFHDLEDPTEALRTVRIFDTRNLVTEPNPIERLPAVAFASIVAAGDRTLNPAWLRRATRQRLGVEPIEIDAGHCPHTTRPVEFVEILDAILAGHRTASNPAG
jgi:pimeloyl-ACP methyl ester carboxylesterase